MLILICNYFAFYIVFNFALSVVPAMSEYDHLDIDSLRELCSARAIHFNHPKDSKVALIRKLCNFDEAVRRDEREQEDVLPEESNGELLNRNAESIEPTKSMEAKHRELTYDEQMHLLEMKHRLELDAREREMKLRYELERQAREEERKHELKMLELRKSELEEKKAHISIKLVKLQDMKEDEEVEEYFQVFEKSMSSLLVPAVEWVANLVPRLNDKSRSVYLELSVEESKDYEKIKVAILESHQLTEDHV